MIKNILLAGFMAVSSVCAFAETENLNIIFKDGTVKSFDISSIEEMNFSTQSERLSGVYSGTVTMTVGGTYSYDTDIEVTVTEVEAGKSISIDIPAYQLSGTMMGDLYIGAISLSGLSRLVWEQVGEGYYLDYGDKGYTLHLKAEQGGKVTMDSDYPLNDPSNITVVFEEDGTMKFDNPFKLGAMPFSLSAHFEGKK